MPSTELAVFGAGCFWAVERAFAERPGVLDTRAGYMGGHVDEPTYAQVCEGDTGHVEVVEVEFDPDEVAYADLLELFWTIHDPTSWDQQGADEGEQYRSVLFVADERQAAEAERSMLAASERFDDAIVTELREVETFWVAEDDHQGFLPRR